MPKHPAPPRIRTRWDSGAMSPAEAAAWSGLSERGIRELMYTGKLTYAVAPHTRNKLIPVESLVAYLDANAEVTEGEY